MKALNSYRLFNKNKRNAMMSYRGYKGYFEYADVFHGQVIGIRDAITFQGRSIDDLKVALKDSVDDLEMCE